MVECPICGKIMDKFHPMGGTNGYTVILTPSGPRVWYLCPNCGIIKLVKREEEE